MSNEKKLPEAFLQRMKGILGEEFNAFLESLHNSPPTSVRVNPFKPVSKFESEEKVSWCSKGFYLDQRPSFTFDPLFHAGTYYVQEASSMFIEEVWKQLNLAGKTLRVLDMCAAPGGKSTHLLSLMNEESILVSNEVIPNRNKILRENIVKWGTANAIITQNKTEDFSALTDFFDLVLIDAPCSGEGMFRKDENAVAEWSEKNVSICAARQNDILKRAIDCLKPGGFLIYSTCTFSPEEDDLQIERSLNELEVSNFKFQVRQPGVVSTKYGFQFYPHKIKGEGFYMAVMQKNGELYLTRSSITLTKKESSVFSNYFHHPEKFVEHKKNDLLFAIPQTHYDDFLFLEKLFYIRQAGICMGTQKGKNFLPSHDLAMSVHLKPDLPFYELTSEESITYLRSESLRLNSPFRGWCLARFEGKNLGWMKLLEGRMNNYYPKDIRILKASP